MKMILLLDRVCWKVVGRIAILIIMILGGAHSKRPVEEVVILRLGELVLDQALQTPRREDQR